MSKCTYSLIMMLFFLPIQTTMASEAENQELCIQEFVAQCMSKCQQTNAIDCTQACQDEADNQCVEAGE